MPENDPKMQNSIGISGNRKAKHQGLISGIIIMLLLLPGLSKAQNGVQGGEFIVEPATLENLGFEWYIDGDDNRNASVKVEYRMAGSDNEW